MKTPIIRLGNLLLIAGVVAVAGCNSSSADSNPVGGDPLAFQPAPEIAQVPPAPGEPAVLPLPPAEVKLDFTPSPNLADLIKLARAGVSESLMLKFIANAPGAFSLGAQEIIYLTDLGVSENVINTLMERDRAYTNAPQPAAVAEIAPAPAPVVVEQAPVVITEPAPVTVNYFYQTLSPYGAWIEVDGYGRCWQPTVVAYQSDWQPYCDRGRWMYTDCGWYWASDYSWGNVAFHYGRWFRHPHRGWCWSPDTVWAPAWVSWRRNSDYCGWAPLPPSAHYRPGIGFFYRDHAVSIGFEFGLGSDCYTFVPRHRFTDSHPRHYATPRHETTRIFNTTTVNNHYSGGGRNDHVFNHGIAPAAITAGTPNQIRPVRAPAPATPTVRTTTTGRGPGTGSGRDRGNFSPGNHDSSTRSHSSAPAQPTRVVAPAITTPPTRTPVTTTPPATTPPVRSMPTDRGFGTGTGRDHGNAPTRSQNVPTRSYNPPPTVVTPATPRPTPAPVVAPPQIRTPVATPPPVTVPPVNRPPSTDRGIGSGRDQGNSSGRDRNSSFRAPSPAPVRPQPAVSPSVAPSLPSRARMPAVSAPAPVRSQPVAPSYTPRPAPAPSAPRMESRPAPAASPAPARSESRSESRSGSDREKRNR